MNYLIGNRSLFLPDQLSGIHELRYNVFYKRLQWDVPTTGQEETDEYDELDPIFIAAFDNKKVRACCRILPTTGSYMLRDTFPSLLGSTAVPEAENIWEISRFAVDKTPVTGVGFSMIPSKMIAHLVKYALLSKIEHYVFATTVGFERLLMRMNVNCERVSSSKQIGKEKCIALWMHIDRMTLAAVSLVAPELFEEVRKAA
jgi:acyl homoserine lactone synthase